jgi:hypothetical protein
MMAVRPKAEKIFDYLRSKGYEFADPQDQLNARLREATEHSHIERVDFFFSKYPDTKPTIEYLLKDFNQDPMSFEAIVWVDKHFPDLNFSKLLKVTKK